MSKKLEDSLKVKGKTVVIGDYISQLNDISTAKLLYIAILREIAYFESVHFGLQDIPAE